MSTFTAIVHKEDDLYVAQCPETGTASQGETIEEAVENLQEATELYLEEFPLKQVYRPILTTFEVPDILMSGKTLGLSSEGGRGGYMEQRTVSVMGVTLPWPKYLLAGDVKNLTKNSPAKEGEEERNIIHVNRPLVIQPYPWPGDEE